MPQVAPPLVPCNYTSIATDCFHNAPTSDPNKVAGWRANVVITDITHAYSRTFNRIFWINLDELGITSSTPLDQMVTVVEEFVEFQNFHHLGGIFPPIAYIVDPPSDLLVTNPNGLQTGLAGGQILTEIPGSTYVTHGQNTAIAIINPMDGSYTTQVIGTPADTFSLTMSRTDFLRGLQNPIVDAIHVEGTLNPNGMNTYTFEMSQPGDLNSDGVVDCVDIAIVKASFGKRSGQPGFNPRADVNHDGVVNVRDLAFVSQRLPAGIRCP